MDEVPALSVKDAALLLANRELLKDKACVVSVHGRVQVVSELFRNKSDQLFIIQLGDSEEGYVVNILIKQRELRHWQRLIWPHCEYVFTCLRATTLQKGICQPLTLFVPVKGTEFHQMSEDAASWEKMDIRELFGSVDVPMGEAEKYDFTKVHNYTGVITSIQLAHYGILELDNKIRLFVVFMPSWDKINKFGVGTKICLFNVHQKGSSEFPKIHLCCCAQSSLKVQELSPLDRTELAESNGTLAEWSQSYDLSLALYDQLWKLDTCLREAFGGKSHNLLKCILQQSTIGKDKAVLEKKSSRNVMQEILLPNHQCPATAQCTHVVPEVMTTVPVYSCLKEQGESLKDLCDTFSHDKHTMNTPLSDQLYWTYGLTEHGLAQSQQILVGVIQLSSRTGQIVLKELTSATELVILAVSPDMLQHKCQAKCFTSQHAETGQRKSSADQSSLDPHQSQTSTDHQHRCPFIQTSLINCIVRIDRFLLVMERFIVSNYPSVEHIGESKYVSQLRRHSCVIFSLRDLTVLLHPAVSRTCVSLKSSIRGRDDGAISMSDMASVEGCSSHIRPDIPATSCDNSKRKLTVVPPDTQDGAQDGICVCRTKIISVIQTESLMLDQHASVAGAGLRFTAVAVMFNAGTILTCSCHGSCTSDSFGKNKLRTNVNIDGKNSEHSSGDLNFCSSDFDLRSKRILVSESTQHEVATTDILELKEINLLFQGKAVKWYSVLHPRYLYRICYTNEDDMKCVFPSTKLKSVLQKTNAKQCYVLDSDNIRLESVAFECLHEKAAQLLSSYLEDSHPEPPSLDDFRTILDGSCSLPLISVVGQIVRRQHYASDSKGRESRGKQKINATYGVSTLDSRCIHITLQDLVSSKQLSVYMNLQQISYPLSLLPGALVEMKRVMPRMSLKGQWYCQYQVVSTVRVIAMPKLHAQDENSTKSDYIEQPVFVQDIPTSTTHRYLSSLWSCDQAAASHVFYSLCHVIRVLRLFLKPQCLACGSALKDNACMSSACNSTAGYLYSRASILVDDGSSTAIVHCFGDTVQELLDLNACEWTELEQLIRVKGEVHLHQPSAQNSLQADSSVESFLHQICDSHCTKREMKLYLTASSTYGVKRNALPAINDYTLEEFPMKTVETLRGCSVTTHSLPFLQLTCVRLEPINCSLQVTENLKSLHL